MPALNRRTVAKRLKSFVAARDLMRAGFAHFVLGAPAPVRVLLISDEVSYTSEQQFAPMWRHADALRRRYGIVLRHLMLPSGRALTSDELSGAEIIGVKLDFRTTSAAALDIVQGIRKATSAGAVTLIYFDGDDDVCIEWPEMMDSVDVYVKKHIFSDVANYARQYQGKSNLTDFVARNFDRSFADNEIRSSGPVNDHRLAMMWLGWNIGLDDKIFSLAREADRPDHDAKNIDVGCRAYVSPDAWIHPLRGPALDRITAMSERFQVLAPRERVSQAQYYEEMRRARICVSPFGYGELCWRDFEAVLCGCLLVKPDMSHIRTWPDLFVADETYAAVRWDYADLEEVCARYLADEGARRRIAENARQVLLAALTEEALLDRIGALLGRAATDANAISATP